MSLADSVWEETNEEIGSGGGTSNKELSDLERGEGALEEHWEWEAESGNEVISILDPELAICPFSTRIKETGTHHKSVDSAVKDAEDPDWSSHVLDTSPHAEHSTSVMIGLKSRRLLSLCQNNHGINNLVELAQVEPPSVEGKTLAPELSVTLDVAEIIDGSWKTAVPVYRSVDGPGHTNEGPCRVNSKEEVVEQDEKLEGLGLCDGVWLAIGKVVGEMSGGSIDGSNGQWDSWLQPPFVGLWGNADWVVWVRSGWDGIWMRTTEEVLDGEEGWWRKVKGELCHAGSDVGGHCGEDGV